MCWVAAMATKKRPNPKLCECHWCMKAEIWTNLAKNAALESRLAAVRGDYLEQTMQDKNRIRFIDNAETFRVECVCQRTKP